MKLCVDRDLNCGDCWLYETVCRQSTDVRRTVGYMKLCVVRDLKCGDSWLHETVCRQRPDLEGQLVI